MQMSSSWLSFPITHSPFFSLFEPYFGSVMETYLCDRRISLKEYHALFYISSPPTITLPSTENNPAYRIQQGGSDDLGFLQDRFSQLIDAEVDRRLEAEANLRAEKEIQEREFLLLQKEKVSRKI